MVTAIAFGAWIWYGLSRMRKKPRNTPAWFLRHRSKSSDKQIIVLVGDSITQGTASASYADLVAHQLGPERFVVVNAGIDGEMARDVLQRLDEIVACEPDVITLLIGTNDASFELSRNLVPHVIQRYSFPEDAGADRFRTDLGQIVRTLPAHCAPRTRARIALLSLPTLGERLDHPALDRSTAYSEIIRDVAREHGVAYLALHEAMVAYLETHPIVSAPPYERWIHTMASMYVKRYLFGRRPDAVAADHGFLLHVDHLHLNDKGAAMVADFIVDYVTASCPAKNS